YLSPPGEVLRLFVPPGGRAAEARRAALTDAGRRAAAGLGQALEPPELQDLPLRERAVLERLRDAGGSENPSVLGRALDGAKPSLEALARRGLIEWSRALRVRPEQRDVYVK